ncbi:hypothetical protein KXW98_001185 [Aspergillus fumigatus]|nr:hypothetical protein KXX45_002856 [Aspergillus fumigatus]KAH1286597.1 hypothetical protein KXX30_008981 [Aspergillus fumigatus]KAH1294794.1 hypothetical protein KXX48_003581 [Aspergillus fumigatus]KAH1300773.1 hypothetical protein KXX11_004841 [Aspergillus fumigatus]KAH1316401.1 hypothetical protein KXX66_006053 [Aspergillus fumigatus]
MASPGDAAHGRQMSLPPPPPLPQGATGSRSSSQSRVDAYGDRASFSTGQRPCTAVSQAQESLQSSSSASEQYQLNPTPQFDNFTRAPGAKRAVSAGPMIGSASSSRATSQSRSHSPSTHGWEPGMPLPPPPPGPPPTARSQSVSGLSETSGMRNSQISMRRRPPPVMGPGLDSIPPTPAGWADEGSGQNGHRQDRELPNIDTSSAALANRGITGSESRDPAHASQTSANSGLFRSPAIRDASAKGIRERRIERRNRQSQVFEDFSAVSSSSNPWADALDQVKPSDLILDNSNASHGNGRHPNSTKFTPRSTASAGSDGQQLGTRSRASSTGLFSGRSSFSTPRAEPSPAGPPRTFAQTPPFSPDNENVSPTFAKAAASQALPPKALPTPPLQSGQDVRSSSRLTPSEERPVSHILHLPNDALPAVAPLSPRRLAAQQGSSLDSVLSQDLGFIRDAMQRHKEFIEKEASAVNETEALRIFADFIIAESQIRRERYGKVWDSGTFDVEAARRKLFELPPKPIVEPQNNISATVSLSRQPSRGPRAVPALDIPTSRPESAWWSNYKPCLSPIASMSMSNDEMSSRGRPPSRWWESKTGSESEGGERKVQRSKRESKYMGVPREAMQWAEGQGSFGASQRSYESNATSQYAAYGPDEYPPEKVGWHEEQEPAPSDFPSSAPRHGFGRTREVQKLDVSRLITLPPPYPRHHPAVNNSHPDLVAYRTLVRSISDLSEIKATRQRHQSEGERLLKNHRETVDEGRRQFKANIQSQIQQGSITFAEAAEAEAALIEEENRLERELVKKELDTYQESVMNPIHAILTDRINRATTCIDELIGKLFDDAQHETPDQTQEEGDEKPELLEKLKQLKWLFEGREGLHREAYELVADRDEKYKAVVLLPYRQKGNEEKIRETEAFFAQDALDRRVAYEAKALSRLESFLSVIEENVVRGVEVQLSAFWDIAPSLLALIQQIPNDLRGFQIQIPAKEFEENPSYHEHPLQYLYTLLSHAEKSSYQFIESQINLFCLLHEVKSAVMGTNCKLMEAQRMRQGEAEDAVRREIQESRADEELALTNDLKDKVATVEGQWTEALGSQIQDVRERVKTYLMNENGWEDLEQLEEA